VQNNRLVYSKGYGYANLEYDIPNTATTVFHVASDSKRFTAMAVALLAQEGKLGLDDDIRKYLPEVPDFGQTITIRQLANHTSGLRDQWSLLALAGWRLDDVITRDQIMKLVTNQKALNFKPGEEHLYCNTGYSLMAEIVERVSGKSFRAYADERIFKPLGMNATHVHNDHEEIVRQRAYSYYPDSSGFKHSVLSYANQGATSLFTTAEDMARWVINFNGGVFEGNTKLYPEMTRRGILTRGDTISYALGMVVDQYKGLRRIGHGGADAGFRSFVGCFPDQQFGVIVLSNLGSFNPNQKAMQIADIILADQLKAEPPLLTKLTERKVAKIDPRLYEYYTGNYQLFPGFQIAVTREGDQLFAQATGQPRFELFPENPAKFFLKVVDAQVTFVQKGKEKSPELILHQGGQNMPAKRVAPYVPTPAALEELTGNYLNEELGTTYRLVVHDGKILARHQRHPDVTLNATAPDELTGDTWWFGHVKFTRGADGKPDGFLLDSGRIRNVRFTRL
jgi:CubicO group peptidase (beta-lactamase class C family)